SDDGKHYVLNGQKQWITNGSFADVFIVYARVNKRITAFIVPRELEGVSVGPEVNKMGHKGSSTTMVYLDNVKVPVENVLGEVDRGHVIAFNVLNLGRWKLAAGALGACKALIEVSAKYAQERKQFGVPSPPSPPFSRRWRPWPSAPSCRRAPGTAPRARRPRRCRAWTWPGTSARKPATPSASLRWRRPSTKCSVPRCWISSRTKRCRFTAATATCRSTWWSGLTGTPASTAFSRAPMKSTACSFRAPCCAGP